MLALSQATTKGQNRMECPSAIHD